jgi:hypothetical protein
MIAGASARVDVGFRHYDFAIRHYRLQYRTFTISRKRIEKSFPIGDYAGRDRVLE